MSDNKVAIKAAPTTLDFGSGDSPFTFMSDASWAMTDTSSQTVLQTQVTTDNDGEYSVDSVKDFGGKTDITANYESKVNTSITMTVSVGDAGDVAVDGLSFSLASGQKAKASVKAHKHTTGTHMARVRAITLPAIPGWGASDFGLGSGLEPACIQSASYDVSFGHHDKPDNVGDHLLGITHNESHTLKIDYVSDQAPGVISGWKMTDYPDGGSRTRDGFISGSVSYVKYVAVAV